MARKQASAPEPLVGPAHPTLDRPVDTSRTSPWRADMPAVRLAARSARARSSDTRLDTVSADQFLPRTSALAGRATDMADLSTVRSAGHPSSR
jgi:hypothetical protein